LWPSYDRIWFSGPDKHENLYLNLYCSLVTDGEALVLGANIDGYIPMKFSAGSILQITGIPITAIAALSPDLAHKAFPKDASSTESP
jgi:hypothetical protein